MIEYELKFLVKKLPKGFEQCHRSEIVDLYISNNHSPSQPNKKSNAQKFGCIRVRKDGNRCEITKKIVLDQNLTTRKEYTIPLDETEFRTLANLPGKKIHKIRYLYP